MEWGWDRSLRQRSRHGRCTVAASRVGPRKALEADDDVREVRDGVDGPAAPRNVDLSETVRKVEPLFGHASGVVDDGAASGVVVRLRRGNGLHDAVDNQIDIKLLTRREGVIVDAQKGCTSGVMSNLWGRRRAHEEDEVAYKLRPQIGA